MDQKTKPTDRSVEDFLSTVPERRKADARKVMSIMRKVTRQPPQLWGDSLIGFGHYFYRYDSGREGLYFLTGLSPRKANLVLYIMPGFKTFGPQMRKLGKHKTGSSCLYLGRLEDIDVAVLTEIIAESVKIMKGRYLTGAPAQKAAEAANRAKTAKKTK